MRVRLALRMVAVAIAAAGFADPVFTVTRDARQSLTITVLETPTLVLPDGNATRRQRAYETAHRVQAGAADLFDTRIRSQSTATDANPCPPDGACVLISDGARPRRLSTNGLLGAIRVGTLLTPNVAIAAVTAPATADPNVVGVIDVELAGSDVRGVTTTLRVFDDDMLVGQSSHVWPGDQNAARRNTARVEWSPVTIGLRDLKVVASTAANEATALDNEAHVAIEILPQIYEVLLYEPQPTWSGTFVRRALEDDTRFAVRSRARLGSSIDVSTAGTPLSSATLERLNVRVVLVTAPEQLTASEVATIEQFMRLRGGSVVVLLDRLPSGAVRRLLPFATTEHRKIVPTPVGPLKATEFITFRSQDALMTPLAVAENEPVVVSRPFGNGRLVAWGAIDAWRFRHENGAFANLWQATVADAAEAAGTAVTISADKRIAQPGERINVDVELRSQRAIAPSIEAWASLACGNVAKPIRLWPAGAPGRFQGELVAPNRADCRIDAVIDDRAGWTPLLIREAPRVLETGDDEISGAVSAYGGTVVHASHAEALITRLRQSASPNRISTPLHPIRSPWWIVPFAASLGAEWWLRRRTGRA